MDKNKLTLIATGALAVILAATGIISMVVLNGRIQKEPDISAETETGLMLSQSGELSLAQGENAVYVSSAGGNDENDGSFKNPVKTFARGKIIAREFSEKLTGDVYVVMRGGEYAETLSVTTPESGREDNRLIICGYPGEEAVITGGKTVTGFTKTEGKPYYEVQVDGIEHVRQLYVDGRLASMSCYTGWIPTLGDWYDDVSDKISDRDGWFTESKYVSGISFYEGMEIVFHRDWEARHFPLKEIKDLGDGRSAMVCKQPAVGWVGAIFDIAADATEWEKLDRLPFYILNSRDFLQKGDFAFDSANKKLYYYPADGVDMEKAVFEIPVSEELMEIKGYDVNSVANNITVRGLTFKLGAWNWPSENGIVGWQADSLCTGEFPDKDNFRYIVAQGNIYLENASNIEFYDNSFVNLGGTAIQAIRGVTFLDIKGNVFSECAAGAVTIGESYQYGAQTDTAANPLCGNVTVKNNIMYDTCKQYIQFAPVTTYFVDTCIVSHNDIINSPWSAMEIGWGSWGGKKPSNSNQNILIEHNRLINSLSQASDGGGIYTLDGQPNSVIRYNYIKGGAFASSGIYHDIGSGFFEDYKNVNDSKSNTLWAQVWSPLTFDIKYRDNYTNTRREVMRGINGSIKDTKYVENREWNEEARNIILGSGLEQRFQSNRLKALGLPSKALLFSFSPDAKMTVGDDGKISEMIDQSANALKAAQNDKAAQPVWQSYSVKNGHSVMFGEGKSLNVTNKAADNVFTAVFAAGVTEKMTPQSLLEAAGMSGAQSDGNSAVKELPSGEFATYVYKYNDGAATLERNGNKILEYTSGAPTLKEDAVIKGSINLGDYWVFNGGLTDVQKKNSYDYLSFQYSGIISQKDLLMWLRADEGVQTDAVGEVTGWVNSADNKICAGFIQPNAGARPKLVDGAINSKPAVRFDGANDFLESVGLRWLDENMTVLYVLKPNGLTGNTIGDRDGKFQLKVGVLGDLTAKQSVKTQLSIPPGSVKSGVAQLLGYRRAATFEGLDPSKEFWFDPIPGISELFVNGAKKASGKTSVLQRDDRWMGFRIGTPDSATINGDLAELLVYSREITDEEMSEASRYLMTKYAIN